MRRFTWGALVAGLAAITVGGEAAAAWEITIIDTDGDCGRTNEIAYDGTRIRLAWVCEAANGTKTVKVAKGPKSGGTFPKVSLGAGSDIDVGKNGNVAFINGNGALRFAREVPAGTGNCGGAAWGCEQPAGVAAPAIDPQISIDSTNSAYITYRNANTLRFVIRQGINDYTLPITFVPGAGGMGAVNGFVDASDPTVGANIAYNIASIAGYTANVKKVFGDPGSTACADTGQCTIGALAVNVHTHQPTLIAGDLYYTRTSSGTWNHQSYTTDPEWATGLMQQLYPCISHGGSNGLILSCIDFFNGWEDELVDGGPTVNASSITFDPSTGLRFISYYDADNEQLKLAREIDD